jgi:hypothetical protein
MERTVYQKLLKWKDAPDRKPLVLLGARQVGKTYILKELGKQEFQNIVYVNCMGNTFAQTLFRDFNIPRIIHAIEVNYEVKIKAGKTLLFFDEIQEVPGGIASLKFFCEDMRPLHVVAAGSLLGLALSEDESFPVGKVNTIKMYPMTFTEFLLAMGRSQLRDAILSADWELLRHLHDLLTEMLRQYYFVGGMPEAVAKWCETSDPQAVRKVQSDILQTYYFDFGKHGKTMIHRIRQVWDSIPAQLAKENKKFIFGAIKKGARAADFEAAIQWLVDAGLIYKVYRVSAPKYPLKFYKDSDAFKVYLLDCGLLALLSESRPQDMLLGDKAFTEFKGSYTENYFMQELVGIGGIPAYYYSKDNSTLEIEFLAQYDGQVFPCEVKAEQNVKAKSLRTFITGEFPELSLHGLRFSMLPYVNQEWMENYPLSGIEGRFRPQEDE